jgi:hypothetical protein
MKLTQAQWALLYEAVTLYPEEVYVSGQQIRCALMLRHYGLVRKTGGFTNEWGAGGGGLWGNKSGYIRATKAGRELAYEHYAAGTEGPR